VRVKIIEDFEASNQVQHVPLQGTADGGESRLRKTELLVDTV
jgi:hypothetical protein